jgi:acetylornithine/N-succinyldiaminopimelate aminotransferase
MNNYLPAPIEITRGDGAYLWDVEGRKYLDFTAGVAVVNLGHSHPKLVEVIREEAGNLIHVSNLFRIPPQAQLAKILCENSFADKCFFSNSGAEAIEAALKLSRKFGIEKRGGAHEVIAAEGSFHGRTFGAMSATGQAKIRDGFGPLISGFVHVPYGDIRSLEEAVTEKTAAVLLEPIQGENGVVIPPPDYLKGVREVCDREGIILIFDEIQTGLGRTGTLFAYEAFGVVPDVMTLAKGLAGGLPMGACLANDKSGSLFRPGDHASTFGGGPLISNVARVVVETILNNGILKNCRDVGEYFISGLREIKDDFDFISEVRGRGLMIGMVLERGAGEVIKKMMERNILINLTAKNVIRFTPPLIITRAEVDIVVSELRGVLREI